MTELINEVKAFSKDLKYEPVPLVEIGWKVVEQWNPKPLESFEGVDLTEFSKRIETPIMSLRMEHFYTDKFEKIHLSWFYYMPKAPRITQALVICPSDDYDLPVFVGDLDERAHGLNVSMIVDLWPTLDLGAEEWYKEKYYDGLAPLYAKYWDLGPQKIMFHPDMAWWRMLTSPYELNIEVPFDQRDTLTAMFTDYLNYYAEICKKAEPIKDPKIKEHIAKKKRLQRKWFREKDPAKGVIIRALGEDAERKIMVGLL
jgi:hypothetical protein